MAKVLSTIVSYKERSEIYPLFKEGNGKIILMTDTTIYESNKLPKYNSPLFSSIKPEEFLRQMKQKELSAGCLEDMARLKHSGFKPLYIDSIICANLQKTYSADYLACDSILESWKESVPNPDGSRSFNLLCPDGEKKLIRINGNRNDWEVIAQNNIEFIAKAINTRVRSSIMPLISKFIANEISFIFLVNSIDLEHCLLAEGFNNCWI